MRSKIAWYLLRLLRKVWVRVVLFAVLAVVTVMLAQVAAPVIPDSWRVSIGASAVDQVLNILASSMLAVTTFSLAIATSAFAAAAQNATPRAVGLLQQDPTAQNVLATFLGAFLFSLLGIIALQAGYYTENGRVVLFAATGLVVALVLIALLRWISHLMRFGRMEDTLDRVEATARQAIDARAAAPFLGGRPLRQDIPRSAVALNADTVGYVQHVDIPALDACAETAQSKLWLAALPGTFVHPGRPLLYAERDPQDFASGLRAAFTLGRERDFEQDPRFGLIVLTEIASRALSPGVNDPGTAIWVIGRLVRLLARWPGDGDPEITCPQVFVPPLSPEELIDDAFRPILRDGAGTMEVQVRLLKALDAVALSAPSLAPAAAVLAVDLRAQAATRLGPSDRQRVGAVETPGLANLTV